MREPERAAPARRRRRRRQSAPWLQRNALSVAAASVLIALLGLGFGLLQMLTRPDSAPALLAINQPEPTAAASSATLTTASIAAGTTIAPNSQLAGPTAIEAPREIRASARVLEANYTVEAGDTLGRIAVRFNTTVERIQALNNMADPRTLRIGAKLVIPPAL
jgi:LysM repeat protein